jgi:hypothetical protein
VKIGRLQNIRENRVLAGCKKSAKIGYLRIITAKSSWVKIGRLQKIRENWVLAGCKKLARIVFSIA